MKAGIKEKNGVTIIELEGNLDYESTSKFKESLNGFLSGQNSGPAKNVLINMQKLNFVGSTGLTEFIAMMKEFNTDHPNLKYCNIQSDFRRLMKAYANDDVFDVFENEDTAVNSFDI